MSWVGKWGNPSMPTPLVRGKNSVGAFRRKGWQHGGAARKCGVLAVLKGAGGCGKPSRRRDYYFLESLSMYPR
ncbi:hypothetical protein HMPREF0262_01510 [Clostridium sp. ATCC 29733]|nr:hypothetical protein HMPREF0262_01510 [Clostridium sp. ATCC 29733]